MKVLKSENIIFMVIISLGGLFSLFYYSTELQEIKKSNQAVFENTSLQRKTVVQNHLDARKNTLASIQSFFAASNFVSLSEFEGFTHAMLKRFHLEEVCWTSADGQDVYSTKSGEASECSRFDLVEPSRFLDFERARLMLSIFVQSAKGQKGFASIIFDLKSLIPSEKSKTVEEYLVLSESIRNRVIGYSFKDSKLVSKLDQVIPRKSSIKYYEIQTFGNVSFLYVCTQLLKTAFEEKIWYVWTTISLLALLTLLSAIFIRYLIVQRKDVEEVVKLRTAELTQFAYRTSHDLKAPLTTIKGLSNYIEMDLEEKDYEEVQLNNKKIYKQASKLEKLVVDILNLAQADKASLENEQISIKKEIESIKEKNQIYIKEKGVDISLTQNQDFTLLSEKTRVVQILENLVMNAVKYSDSSKKDRYVKIGVIEKNDQWVIEVKDNGLGFPADKVSEVFNVFQRYHPHAAEGSGLGLAIIKRHVDQLEGEISLASSPEGSTFTFSIPKKKAK